MLTSFRSLLPLLLAALLGLPLASCGIDADDMNSSGYRALAFDIPDQATKYFSAARELITDEVGPANIDQHEQYARMRVGELIVASWLEPTGAFDDLRNEVARVPDLLTGRRCELLIDHYSKQQRFAEALSIARHAAAAFPDYPRLSEKRDNLQGRLAATTEAVPDFSLTTAAALPVPAGPDGSN